MPNCRCGAAVASNDVFCARCGAPVGQSCPSCDRTLEPDDRFCRGCGTEVWGDDHGIHPLWPEGERRQLTMLFCDLVGSTSIGQQLDAEAYAEIIQDYVSVAAGAIEDASGFVAQVQGDGIVAYFGYPEAHDDDPERAVTAGLDIHERLAARDAGPGRDVTVVSRVGIHTGPVVLNEVGRATREVLALGNTGNLAARVESVTPPGGVGISAATLELLRGSVVVDDASRHSVKGVEGELEVFTVSAVRSSATRGSQTGGAPIIGRDQEFAQLRAAWDAAKDGRGATIVLSGEAGIGKSRLVAALVDHAGKGDHVLMTGCSSTGSANAFDPIIRILHESFSTAAGQDPASAALVWEQRLCASDDDPAESLPYLLALAGLPAADLYPLEILSPHLQLSRTIEAVATAMTALAASRPTLVVIEDVHWSDPSTESVLAAIAAVTSKAPILMLLTTRPSYTWDGAATVIPVGRLDDASARALVHASSGLQDGLEDVVDELVARADGVPLFLEELTAAVVAGAGAGAATSVPESLQDSLMARLDRSGSARSLAHIASVIGRSFDPRILREVAARSDVVVGDGLHRLEADGITVSLPNGHYMFRHVLLREAASASMLRRTRRRLCETLVDVIQQEFPDLAAHEPARMARYSEEAGLLRAAIDQLVLASIQAESRLASLEAADHLERALVLFAQLPDDERRSGLEIAIRAAYGGALATRHGLLGAPVVETFRRLENLEANSDSLDDRLVALLALTDYRSQVSDAGPLIESGTRLLDLAERLDLPLFKAKAHTAIGVGGSSMLLPAETMAHLDAVEKIAASDNLPPPTSNHQPDVQVLAAATMGLNLALVGHVDDARERSEFALQRANVDLQHAFSRGSALTLGATVHFNLGEPAKVLARATEGAELGAHHGFSHFEAMNLVQRGWAMTATGGDGSETLRRGLDLLETSTMSSLPYQLSLAALEALHRADIGQARRYVQLATDQIERTGSSGYLSLLWIPMARIAVAEDQTADAVDYLVSAVKIGRMVGHWFTAMRAAREWCELNDSDTLDTAFQALRDARAEITGGKDLEELAAVDALLSGGRG